MSKFQLLEAESVDEGIKRILRELLTENIQMLREPGDDPDKSVHNVRKNCKRLRAVLRLVRDTTGEEAYKRENIALRDASRRLSPMRDAAVLIETLDRITDHFEQPEGTLAAMRAQLVADYEATHDRFWADTAVIPEVIGVFEEAHGRVEQLDIPQDDFSALRDGLKRVYKRGRKAMKRAHNTNSPEDFHEWRKRVKYLWHHTELLLAGWPVVLTETAEELHDLSTFLGDAHDLAVLMEAVHAEPDKYGTAVEIDHMTDLATQRMHSLEAEATPLGRRLYVEKPKAFVKRIGAYWQVWHETGYNGPAEVSNQ